MYDIGFSADLLMTGNIIFRYLSDSDSLKNLVQALGVRKKHLPIVSRFLKKGKKFYVMFENMTLIIVIEFDKTIYFDFIFIEIALLNKTLN